MIPLRMRKRMPKNWKQVNKMRKILFPLKCIAAVLLSPLLLAAVGALLVMRYEDQLLD